MLHIVGLLGHSNGYYDLLLTHHRLGIVALHVPLPGLHDAAAEVSGPDSLTSALTPVDPRVCGANYSMSLIT